MKKSYIFVIDKFIIKIGRFISNVREKFYFPFAVDRQIIAKLREIINKII